MDTEKLSVRLPSEIIYGIDQYGKKHKLEFRTEALIAIVTAICKSEKIDISKVPDNSPPPISEAEDCEEDPHSWICPYTNRPGDFMRCERRAREHKECETCTVIPRYYYDVVFRSIAELEKKKQKSADAKSTDIDLEEKPSEKNNWTSIFQTSKSKG